MCSVSFTRRDSRGGTSQGGYFQNESKHYRRKGREGRPGPSKANQRTEGKTQTTLGVESGV